MPRASDAWFRTTHWSVVLSARDQSGQATTALDTLCQQYWYPLYAYVRRCGRSPEEAQDLTQEFFFQLLQHNYLQAVAQEKGRFRTFLIVAIKRLMANEWDKARAQKRGGGQRAVSWDAIQAEERFKVEPAMALTPDKIYDRRWALTLLERTMGRLQAEFAQRGKAEEYEKLKVFLGAGKGMISYVEVAREMGMNEAAFRVAVHRLRRRFREIFQEEVAQTVSQPEEIEQEVRYLISVLGEGLGQPGNV